jgi:hypothetical protein
LSFFFPNYTKVRPVSGDQPHKKTNSVVAKKQNLPARATALLKFLQYRIQIETTWLLSGWKLLISLQVHSDKGRSGEQNKRMIYAPSVIVACLVIGPFVRIGSKAKQFREPQCH